MSEQAVTPMIGASPERKFWARVVKGAGCWEWNGSHTTAGYANLNLGGGKYGYGHRVSYEIHKGKIPAGYEIDHMCHNRGCVNPDHLRAVTRGQNCENLRTESARNKTSGIRGVAWDKSTRSWMTYAQSGGKRTYGPRFAEISEAAESVRRLRLSLHTHNDTDRTKP